MALKTVAAGGEATGMEVLEARTSEIQAEAEAESKPLEIARSFHELMATPARVGQDLAVRQIEAFSALTAVRSPQDLFELQAEHGRKAIEAYAAEVRRANELLGQVLRESTRAFNSQAAKALKF
jgi:hypothetical protein